MVNFGVLISFRVFVFKSTKLEFLIDSSILLNLEKTKRVMLYKSTQILNFRTTMNEPRGRGPGTQGKIW